MEHIRVQLLDSKTEIQYGLGWGLRENRDPDQAYLQLESEVYKSNYFPQKGVYFIVKTDDGETLIMNRAQKDYGCALQTPESNSIIGLYLRRRLGLASGQPITKDILFDYGKLDIDFYKIDDKNYFMSFSLKWKSNDIRYLFEQYLIIKRICSTWKEVEQRISILESLDKKCFESNATLNIDEPIVRIYNEFVKSDFYKEHYGMPEIRFDQKASHTPPLPLPHQLIYYGAPGTGKSYTIDNQTDPERTIRTTFHPDSDYASFVGAYKPTMARMPVIAFNGTQVTEAEGVNGHDGKEERIVYKYVPQAFLKAYVGAWSNLDKPYYLVIEEINRGNCAQIFGDLFQLLDRNNSGSSSYAIDADEDIVRFLAEDKKGFAGLTETAREAISEFVLVKDNGRTEYLGKDILSATKLLLPPNLYIWATMNTSDQSLFPIDSAFKRRWNWKYVAIDCDKEDWTFAVGNNRYSWGEFLRKINPIITRLTASSDKQMGYYFAKPDQKSDSTLAKNDIISEDIFVNKVLFYLWTDVLKHFDAGEEPFVNSVTAQTYEFADFFDTGKGCLQEFVDKFELTNLAVKPGKSELNPEDAGE